MFIIIEGSDFAGKSSVSDRVDMQLRLRGVQVQRSRTCLVRGPFRTLAWIAHRLPVQNEFLKSLAFHAAYLVDSLFWRPPDGKVVIQESYVLRVLAHDIVSHRSVGQRFMRTFWHKLPRPDLAYFLDCAFEARRHRYLNEGRTNRRDDARFGADSDRQKAYSEQLAALADREGYRLLDTGRMNADDAASIIVGDIMRILVWE